MRPTSFNPLLSMQPFSKRILLYCSELLGVLRKRHFSLASLAIMKQLAPICSSDIEGALLVRVFLMLGWM